MRGGRPGAGPRGGKAGIDAQLGATDVTYYRHAGVDGVTTGGTRETFYVWGRHTHTDFTTPNFVLATAADVMFCIPQVVPRSTSIRRLVMQLLTAGAVAGAQWRVAIYSNREDLRLYPGFLLWQSATFTHAGIQTIEVTPGVSVDECLLWVVFTATVAAGALELRSFGGHDATILGGMPATGWTTAGTWNIDPALRPFVGWSIPRAFALGLPTVAPIGVLETTVLQSARLPCFGYVLGG